MTNPLQATHTVSLKQGKSLVIQDNDLLETSLITILRQFPQTNLQTGDNKEP